MRMIAASLLGLVMSGLPASAQDLPPGLLSARLLPGWTDAQGNRIAALELVLQDGWKTYWRNPGDSGLPPDFDWQGSGNLAGVTLHWPAPALIDSGGVQSLGFHDRLILPFTAQADRADRPVSLVAEVDFGLCKNICIPASLSLIAPPAGQSPDPVIERALADQPKDVPTKAICRMDRAPDAINLTLDLPDVPIEAASVEIDSQPDLWVSDVALERRDGRLLASVELLPRSQPFTLDPDLVRLTLIGAGGATEMRGCLVVEGG